MSSKPRPQGGWQSEPTDPDTADVAWDDSSPGVVRREQAQILVAISLGGAVGACARYGAGLLWPTPTGHFPWTTFWINVVGCGLMGVLMVLVSERFTTHHLVRPFLGTGVLGGFTTFSSATVDLQRLLTPQTSGTALLYAAGTVLAAVAAVWVGVTLTRFAVFDRTEAAS
ncbi:fluoride efflux transporter FluC [Nocardioides acrostichi]|uniref:Fluoride-specific ion channel FluC n=1 Tax=Nocardioides acrostichi TaxID=2784339 RepID=A0A930V0R0_9ACTN|nr:CrcB family protein [Nocardioides acrostichi]MBF4161612.1 CrcB family protein [Nocardioides acrostichi]